MPEADRSDLALIEEAARVAGMAALRSFRAGGARRWTKADDSPVTEADIAADTLLRERLMAARPDYGWLSEESEDDGSRRDRVRVFIVDPIDGTRSFIAGEDEWVVSVGVVEAGRPVAGVLFNPVRDEMWTTASGLGSRRNGTPVRSGDRGAIAGAHIAAPRTILPAAGLNVHERDIRRSTTKSLAYRLAGVADGTYDAALASKASRDWDLAAAMLLVQEAGGRISDLDGRPLRLNGEETRHPPFVAAGAAMHSAIMTAAAAARENMEAGR